MIRRSFITASQLAYLCTQEAEVASPRGLTAYSMPVIACWPSIMPPSCAAFTFVRLGTYLCVLMETASSQSSPLSSLCSWPAYASAIACFSGHRPKYRCAPTPSPAKRTSIFSGNIALSPIFIPRGPPARAVRQLSDTKCHCPSR